MRILVSNDDGYFAGGIAPLVEALQALGEVWVVAPEQEQSAKSHSLTMWEPLRVRQHGAGRYSVGGTPADCVYLALHELLPERPDLVVSGINRGSNLGNDVLYSGTVAAAMEACLHGVPALAVSLHLEPEQDQQHWGSAASLAQRVAAQILERGLPRRKLLNLNVPNLPLAEIQGIRPSRLGERSYEDLVDKRLDPRGKPYYWIGGGPNAFCGEPDTDGPLMAQGWASLTPLSPDLTDEAQLERLKSWSF